MRSENIQLRDRAGRPLGKPMCGGYLYDGAELSASVDVPREWGPWRLDAENLVLYLVRPHRYEVDLGECLSSARVLDKIIHISQKSWADDELVGGLIRALGDVLNPQANLCTFGRSSTVSRAKIRQLACDAICAHDPAFVNVGDAARDLVDAGLRYAEAYDRWESLLPADDDEAGDEPHD